MIDERKMVMGYFFCYDTPLGKIKIGEEDNYITHILYERSYPPHDYILKETPMIKNALLELEEYFRGERMDFDLPIKPKGTEFMKKVWTSLLKIPYGETRSYKDIAISVGKEKAYRAVGMANNKNPISIIIPCHRVIGSKGSLVGYGGGLDTKDFLLKLEKENINKR